MTMTKKSSGIALAASATAAALVLAACGDSNGTDNGNGTGNGGDAGGGGVEHTLIAGHQLAVDTPFDAGMNRFAELVEEKTEGRVVVEVHPNAALGNEPEMFQGLQSGSIDVGIFAPGSIGEFAPEMSLLSVPFLIIDRDQRDTVIAGEIGQELADALLESTGTLPLTYFGGSYRQMFFTDPADSWDDVQGRLFRVQPSDILVDSYAAVGLDPTAVAYTELYNALQQGVVDGAENESVFIDSQNFFEPAPNLLQTNHEVTIRPLLISEASLDSLGEELAGLVREAAEETGEYQRALEADEDDAMFIELGERDGVTITEIDTAPLIEQIQPVWFDYAEQWEVEHLLEQIIELRPES
ncbi:tripartite ATP-independent transporter DctP family solute receptor [Bogoriella caseilytica]|uniref:Tripartite ATP-independent transporter DctP family solute receptor n=2 Tax=Bogoriella caseilytica TaxID=56055 RepID=A0A3N2BD28_9MICO|nr:tripartite ATP-independent transporter DctP family solute receptor [Bogoriella caseilytica]